MAYDATSPRVIIFGGLTYLYWRHNRSWRDSAPPMPAGLAPAPGTA